MLRILRFAVLLLATAAALPAQRYDPLAIPAATLAPPRDLTIRDSLRSRDIPIRIYLPASNTPAPVLLFSHGLGGSRENNAYLGNHWSARGYIVVAMQHAGSDDAVWKDVRPLQRMAAMRQAASAENLVLRLDDVRTVLDQLTAWQGKRGHLLAGRLDLAHVGMSGHSFGAATTQGVSGQSFPILGTSRTDPRITAALILSPSAPHGGNAAQAFAGVTRPWLLMTGTRDVAAVGNATLEDRLAVFPALPPGGKYQLVLDGAEHLAFGDSPERGGSTRNPNHHRAIIALSTAFWDAYLRGDAAARAWLDGEGPRGVLEPKDAWSKK